VENAKNLDFTGFSGKKRPLIFWKNVTIILFITPAREKQSRESAYGTRD